MGPAPAWATGNKKIGPYKVKAKYFGEFAQRVVQQYGGLVDRYSIWNEPNYIGWLAPLASAPKLYRAMYVEGYQAIKAGNPNAQVLIGETSPYALRKRASAPLDFLRKMTCANRTFTSAGCGGLKADGYAHHPYDFDHPPSFKFPGADNATINTLGRLTTALDNSAKAGGVTTPAGGALDLYLTEYGYFRSGGRKVAESKRAKYLVQAFEIAQQNPRVREMLQYLIVQPGEEVPLLRHEHRVLARHGFQELQGSAEVGQLGAVERPHRPRAGDRRRRWVGRRWLGRRIGRRQWRRKRRDVSAAERWHALHDDRAGADDRRAVRPRAGAGLRPCGALRCGAASPAVVGVPCSGRCAVSASVRLRKAAPDWL